MLLGIAPEYVRLLAFACLGAAIAAVILYVLVRFAAVVAVIGVGAYLTMLAVMPQQLPETVLGRLSHYVLTAGLILFALTTVGFEFVRWRQDRERREIENRYRYERWIRRR